MKFSALEEYGLRCLLRIARQGEGESLTIPEISRAEGISTSYVAKLLRLLRRGGFVESSRGKSGGYSLARSPEKIVVGEVQALLGGRLFDTEFCDHHAGYEEICANSTDCSIRSLWRVVQSVVDQVLGKTTLRDLMFHEQEMTSRAHKLVRLSAAQSSTPNLPS